MHSAAFLTGLGLTRLFLRQHGGNNYSFCFRFAATGKTDGEPEKFF